MKDNEPKAPAPHPPPGASPPATDSVRRLFVDELLDDGLARVLLGEDALTVPLALLPAGVKEGTWIELSGRVIPAPPTVTEDLRRRLAADDSGGPLKL